MRATRAVTAARATPATHQATPRTSEKVRKANQAKKRRQLLRTTFWGIALPIAVVAGFIAALPRLWNFVHDPVQFPIKTLALSGKLHYVSEDWLRQSVAAASAKGFFGLDVPRLRETVCAQDWVAACEVHKTWPDRVQISIVEHKPLARWGDSQLINEAGALFTLKAAAPTDLPRLDGPKGQSQRVLKQYRELAARLAELGLYPKALGMNEREAWQFVLGDGVIVHIGREDYANRVERFLALYPRLKNDPQRILEYVDLRYDTGIAVGWKAEPKVPDGTDARIATLTHESGIQRAQ